MSEQISIRGAGGGKKTPRQPVEASDTLRSAQYGLINEIISEGEIEGLVDGARSIYLDDTPLESVGGVKNFQSVVYYIQNGSQSQGRTWLSGGFNGVQSVTDVSVEMKANTPITRSINNVDIDWVKVVIGVPTLTHQDKENGDTNGTSVKYKIEVQRQDAGFQTKVNGEISGKTTSYYKREHKITLSDEGPGPWLIRVTRETADSTTQSLQNQTIWSEMVEGIDVKLSYPNTAVASLRIDAEEFKSIPKRGYHIRGIRVKVPTNYNPITRQYTEFWDGSFKIAWTDNPAWCFYDLLTNERYGLGTYLEPGQIDKWTLYQIARYCDQLVPDGFGGQEPRFTCNLFLQTREDAYKVVNSMASIFRGMVYYADGEILFSQDAPADPVAVFSASNVIEGMFTYQSADRRARHTVALVSWNDPGDMYRQKIEYVSDPEGIERWGVVQTEILAVGCTSRGQAHRMGKWTLFTEQHESETVSFRAGMDAARCAPGDVIMTQDAVRSGSRQGGRVKVGGTTSIVTDAPVSMTPGVSYTVSVMMENLMLHESVATGVTSGDSTTFTFVTPASSPILTGAMWVLSSVELVPEKWRVITISEVEPSIVEITALYHNPGKFAFIEQNVALEDIPTSIIKTRPKSVTNLQAKTEVFRLNDAIHSLRIAISWTAPVNASSYVVTWRKQNENEKSFETSSPSGAIENVSSGSYTIKVAARNGAGITGPSVSLTHLVQAAGVEDDVQNLRANPNFLGRDLPVTWDALPGAHKYAVRVLFGSTVLREEEVSTNSYVYTFATNVYDGGPNRVLTIQVKARTLAGESANWASQEFSNPAPAAPLGLQIEPGPGQIAVLATRPLDEDLQGMIVWMSGTSGFTPSEANRVYRGSDNAFMKNGLQPAAPYYFRVAFFDTFGQSGLNMSTEVSSSPTATGGILSVTTLPTDPSQVNGELAVFLDVEDPATRGLHGWTGTQWVNTRILLDGSVTGDKLALEAVDYTKLAAGAVKARNLSVKKHFLY